MTRFPSVLGRPNLNKRLTTPGASLYGSFATPAFLAAYAGGAQPQAAAPANYPGKAFGYPPPDPSYGRFAAPPQDGAAASPEAMRGLYGLGPSAPVSDQSEQAGLDRVRALQSLLARVQYGRPHVWSDAMDQVQETRPDLVSSRMSPANQFRAYTAAGPAGTYGRQVTPPVLPELGSVNEQHPGMRLGIAGARDAINVRPGIFNRDPAYMATGGPRTPEAYRAVRRAQEDAALAEELAAGRERVQKKGWMTGTPYGTIRREDYANAGLANIQAAIAMTAAGHPVTDIEPTFQDVAQQRSRRMQEARRPSTTEMFRKSGATTPQGENAFAAMQNRRAARLETAQARRALRPKAMAAAQRSAYLDALNDPQGAQYRALAAAIGPQAAASVMAGSAEAAAQMAEINMMGNSYLGQNLPTIIANQPPEVQQHWLNQYAGNIGMAPYYPPQSNPTGGAPITSGQRAANVQQYNAMANEHPVGQASAATPQQPLPPLPQPGPLSGLFGMIPKRPYQRKPETPQQRRTRSMGIGIY